MANHSLEGGWLEEYPSARYIAPFALFLFLLAFIGRYPLNEQWEPPTRILLLGLVLFACWPRQISLRPVYWLASAAAGAGVFLIWIAPDLLFRGYRTNLLFSNSLVGHMHSSLSPAAQHSPWSLTWRTIRAVLIVPFVEELFWRAWLLRWLVDPDFRRVSLGTYAPFAFWLTAILFASEHGPYWDVGLVTGIIYNFWMIRSKSLADCILMHATTNALLSTYVIVTEQWQYWQ